MCVCEIHVEESEDRKRMTKEEENRTVREAEGMGEAGREERESGSTQFCCTLQVYTQIVAQRLINLLVKSSSVQCNLCVSEKELGRGGVCVK